MEGSVMEQEVKNPAPFFDIKTAAQARALLRYLPEIAAATGKPVRVSELARVRRLSVAATSYRVQQLVKLDLLRSITTRTRGRTYQTYQAAPRWRVRHDLLPAHTVQDFMEGHFGGKSRMMFVAFEQHLRASGQSWALELDLDAMDYFRIDTGHDLAGPQPLILNHTLRLRPHEAAGLRHDLLEVLERYRELSESPVAPHPEAQPYLMGVLLTRNSPAEQ